MLKLTFPPKTELSRESGADLDFQDILVRWRKSLPTVSYFLGGTSIRFPDGGEIRCFQPAGGTPHAHVPEARWRIYNNIYQNVRAALRAALNSSTIPDFGLLRFSP